jgi:TolA-binding protein
VLRYSTIFLFSTLLCVLSALGNSRGLTAGQLAFLDPASESTSVLIETVKELLRADQMVEAIPFMEELLVRLEEDEDTKAQKTRAYTLYQLGQCRMKLGSYEEAAGHLVEFADLYTNEVEYVSARIDAARCYTLLEEWSKVEEQSTLVLQNPLLPDAQKRAVIKVQGEALYRQEKWAEAVRPLNALFRMSQNEVERNSAAVMLVTCYVRSGAFDRLFAFLPECEGGGRYDVGLNVALLEAGDEHYKRGEFHKALMLYRLVMGRQELINYYEALMAAILASIRPPVAGGEVSIEAQKEANLERQLRHRRMALQLEVIQRFEDYDLDVLLRIAQCYADLKRNWPAYTVYKHLYTTYPDHALAEQGRYSAFIAMTSEEEWELALSEGYAFVEALPEGEYIDDVTLNLLQIHMQREQLDRAYSMGLKALEISPDHTYIDQVSFLLGYIQFVRLDYASAQHYFDEVLRRWPESNYYEPAEYWRAMSQLFQGSFAAAAVSFQAYLTNPLYAELKFGEDAQYRLGFAQFGAEQFAEAEETFRAFLVGYPHSSLISEALAMIGDLRGEAGDLEAAIDFYEQAIIKAETMAQRNYPTFRMAAALHILERYELLVERMADYIRIWGERGEVAQACNWQAKAYKSMEPPAYEKALDAYTFGINTFGQLADLATVDAILREILADWQSESWKEQHPFILQRMKDELRQVGATDASALRMRYETLLALMLEADERDDYVMALLKPELVDEAGPLTLQLMAEEAVKAKQYGLVHAAYNRYLAHFGVSRSMLYVMNAELEALVQEGNFEAGAMLAEDIMVRFGHSPSVAWAWKRRGDAYRLLKQYEDAEASYNYLLGIREWRGELTPEAHYWLGVCKMEQGKHRDAYAHFQRIYVLYEEYTDWVAKAYLKSVECLKELGEDEYVLNTYREMLANEAVASTEEGRRARVEYEALKPVGGAE